MRAELFVAVGLMWMLTCAVTAQVQVSDDAERMVIRTSTTTIALSKKEKGAIGSMVDNTSGQEFTVQDAPVALLRICVSERDKLTEKPTWLSSADAGGVAYAVKDGRAVVTFSKMGGRDITAVCSVAPDAASSHLHWDVQVESAEAVILEHVEYPVFALRAPLAGDGASDAFVFGYSKGGVFHQPHRWRVGQRVSAEQPSVLAAQFGCYYNSRSGICSFTQDTEGYPKTFGMRRTKNGLEMYWDHHGFHDLAASFDLAYAVALTTFRSIEKDIPTDWRDGADIYKAWALKQRWCKQTLAERADLPDWLRQGPMMVRFGRHWLGNPERVEAWLNEYYRKHFPKVPLIAALWGWEGIGTWVSPKYFPPYPSEEGFRRYMDAIRGVGGHPFFWPSGYQWALRYDIQKDGSFRYDGLEYYEKEGQAHTIVSRDGSYYLRKYPWVRGGRNATLCRGDAWTRNWLNNIAVELTKYGADMIQVDQVVSAGMPGRGKCFSRTHGHPVGPGLWDAAAFHDQLRTMAKACNAIRPGIILGFEEPQELYNHYIGIQDYRDWQVVWRQRAAGHVPASVFSYIYHEFVPCFQSNPRRADRRMMAYCLVNGQIPHLVPHWPVQPAPLLQNGTFEEWVDNVPDRWQHVKGWRKKKYEGLPFCDRDVKHSGQFSLRLECDKEDGVTQVSQNVPIGKGVLEVGKRYRLSLWYKAEKLPKENAIPFAALAPQLKSKRGWRIPIAKCDEWRRGEEEFTIPEGAEMLRIMLNIVGPCKVWLDDIALEEPVGGEWRPVMTKGIPADHDLAARWVELFHGEGRPYLLLGCMLHPPKLECQTIDLDKERTLPAILHNAYRAPDGSEAVVLANITDETQHGKLTWAGKTLDISLEPREVEFVK